MGPIGTSCLHLLEPRAARRPKTDLEDLIDMGHLGRAPDRAGQAVTHPVHLVAPIDVLIDLDERDRA